MSSAALHVPCLLYPNTPHEGGNEPHETESIANLYPHFSFLDFLPRVKLDDQKLTNVTLNPTEPLTAIIIHGGER